MKKLYLIAFGVLFFSTEILSQNNKDCADTSDCVGKIFQETIKANNQTPVIQVNRFEVKLDSKISRHLETKSIIRIYNERKNLSVEEFELGFYTRWSSEEPYRLISIKNSCEVIDLGNYNGFECSFFSELPISIKRKSYECKKGSFSHLANSKPLSENIDNQNSINRPEDCLIQIELENKLDRDNQKVGNDNDEIYMDVIRIFRSN